MAVHTSKVTTQSNADLQLDPDGSGVVQLNKLTGGGASQPVGVDNTGKTKKFLPGDTAARGAAAGSDIVMVQASGASTVTQTTITALVTAGGGGGSGGIALSDLSVTTDPSLSSTGGLAYNNTNGVFTYTGVAPAQISDSAPGSAEPGQLWWDSEDGELYVYYNDGSSSQWVPASHCCSGTTRSIVFSDSIFSVKTVSLGDSLTLDARISDTSNNGTGTFSFKWYKNNQEISARDVGIIQTNSVLQDHLGVYTCQIGFTSDDDGETRRLSKVFVVTEAKTPLNATTSIGGDGPVSAIEFEKNGSGYTSQGPVTVSTSVGSLEEPSGPRPMPGNNDLTLSVTSDGDAITSVAVVDPGTGYPVFSEVTIDGGNNDAKAIIYKTITTTISNAGTNYPPEYAGTRREVSMDGVFDGAYVDIGTIDSYGGITAATLVLSSSSASERYENGDVVTVDGGDDNATLTIASMTTEADMPTGGSGYTNVGTATINATGGSGSNCTVDVTSNGNEVTEVVLNTAGTGYFFGERLTLDAGDRNAFITIQV